ncbi:hypothetical protein DESA109040_01455 [Deinococcus saxicola]|uniref:FAD-dependent oxidoreductase n=1 Tax=Deinococcus saxicola TaxID=249406 RepID=UPI0039EF95BD
MTLSPSLDVLIAGAGPVGLLAAWQLARRGVSVRLVDLASGPATTSRALATHARSLEIYDQLGILGDIAPHGTRVNGLPAIRATVRPGPTMISVTWRPGFRTCSILIR